MAAVVESPPIGFLVDLVNFWAERVHHDPAPEGGRPYPSRQLFSDRYGVDVESSWPDSGLITVADKSYLVFASAPDGRLDRANDLVRAANLRPMVRDGPSSWETTGTSLVGAFAAAALLLHAQSDPSLSRLGVCTAHRCRDAYVDGSQGRTRRFCTERCQTRAKARRRRR